jgi:hypothetical protein
VHGVVGIELAVRNEIPRLLILGEVLQARKPMNWSASTTYPARRTRCSGLADTRAFRWWRTAVAGIVASVMSRT